MSDEEQVECKADTVRSPNTSAAGLGVAGAGAINAFRLSAEGCLG